MPLHQTISLSIAAVSLGLLYLFLCLGPLMRRRRQRNRLLPVPVPYPPSGFPQPVHQVVGAVFVTLFFYLCIPGIVGGEDQEDPPLEKSVPTLVEEQTASETQEAHQPATDTPTPELPPAQSPTEETACDREEESAATSEPADQTPEPQASDTPAEEAQPDTIPTTTIEELVQLVADPLFTLLLFSPLLILFLQLPSAHPSSSSLAQKAAVIFLYLLLNYLISTVYQLTNLPTLLTEWTQAPELQPISQDVAQESSPLALCSMAISIIIIAPICEEICFRGFIFNSLVQNWGLPLAAIFTGILFGAVHFSLLHFIPLSILGTLLAISYYRTRTIWTPITIHALFNAIGFLALLQYT